MAWDLGQSNESRGCITLGSFIGSNKSQKTCWTPMNHRPFPKSVNDKELETFVRSKKTKSGARSAVDHFSTGILGWVLGHSGETFQPLWAIVGAWKSYFGSHRWLERISELYPTRRSDCQQNLHDTGRR